jgi:hypothetical protein
VTQFVAKSNETDYKLINNVMENYFNRNNIKAIHYLQDNNLPKLLTVWQKYHHTVYSASDYPKITSASAIFS